MKFLDRLDGGRWLTVRLESDVRHVSASSESLLDTSATFEVLTAVLLKSESPCVLRLAAWQILTSPRLAVPSSSRSRVIKAKYSVLWAVTRCKVV